MLSTRRLVSTIALAVLALCSATLSAYLLSVASMGRWKYPEVTGSICASAVITVLALAVIAFINKRESGRLAIVRLTALLILGCGAVAATVHFAVLANCSLFCKNVIQAESRSPNGRWRAIRFSRKCVAPAGYCPLVTYVSILPSSAGLPDGEGNGLAILGDQGIGIEWKSEDLLVTSYPAVDRVLRLPNRVGNVRLEYRPIGFM
jgi:hypothetical protein